MLDKSKIDVSLQFDDLELMSDLKKRQNPFLIIIKEVII